MIRALIRQDFLPATARGGGGAGEKQGQPKVKFHSQGLEEPPPPPHWQMPFRGLQHTSPTRWLLSEDTEAQWEGSQASLSTTGRTPFLHCLGPGFFSHSPARCYHQAQH